MSLLPSHCAHRYLFVLGRHPYTITMYQSYLNYQYCFWKWCETFHGVVGHVSWLVLNFVGYAVDLRQVKARQHWQSCVPAADWMTARSRLDAAELCIWALCPHALYAYTVHEELTSSSSIQPQNAEKFTYTSFKRISTDEIHRRL